MVVVGLECESRITAATVHARPKSKYFDLLGFVSPELCNIFLRFHDIAYLRQIVTGAPTVDVRGDGTASFGSVQPTVPSSCMQKALA